jgi:CRP-like cAMP-binding protein
MLDEAFSFLTPEQRGILLERAREERYEEGAAIVTEDHVQGAILVVKEGRVSVEKSHFGGRVPISELGPGALLGEVSYLDGSPASASVVARTPVTVLVLEGIDDLLSSDPDFAGGFYRSLAVLLAQRLRHTTEDRVVSALQWG